MNEIMNPLYNPMKVFTPEEMAVITAMNSHLMTVEFCAEWKARIPANVLINAPAALQQCTVSGYLGAVARCVDMKNFPLRTNEGYTIIWAIRLNDTTEVVLGILKNERYTMYVTWECQNGDHYYWGHYFNDPEKAVSDLLSRAEEWRKQQKEMN
jgi:hypothetical protein